MVSSCPFAGLLPSCRKTVLSSDPSARLRVGTSAIPSFLKGSADIRRVDRGEPAHDALEIRIHADFVVSVSDRCVEPGQVVRFLLKQRSVGLVDAWLPAEDAFKVALQEGVSGGGGLARSATPSKEGMKASVPIVAKTGRARRFSERSGAHQEPGVTSS